MSNNNDIDVRRDRVRRLEKILTEINKEIRSIRRRHRDLADFEASLQGINLETHTLMWLTDYREWIPAMVTRFRNANDILRQLDIPQTELLDDKIDEYDVLGGNVLEIMEKWNQNPTSVPIQEELHEAIESFTNLRNEIQGMIDDHLDRVSRII